MSMCMRVAIPGIIRGSFGPRDKRLLQMGIAVFELG